MKHCWGLKPISVRRLLATVETFLLAAVLAMSPAFAFADAFPLWQKWLRHTGGNSDATAVRTMMMGPHMQMSVTGDAQPDDALRAETILNAARRALNEYRDVRTAERAGYRAFAPSGKVGEEVHYTNYWRARRENVRVDYQRPGSILYKRTPQGMQAVGVMYTAPARAGPAELDARVPLSVGVWHRHVDFCGWPKSAPRADWDGPEARFGFNGSLHEEGPCEQAGGLWIPVALGWMTHIYPNEEDHQKVWMGEHLMAAHASDAQHLHEEAEHQAH